jgi:outer membrane biosynthesis protein TonB
MEFGKTLVLSVILHIVLLAPLVLHFASGGAGIDGMEFSYVSATLVEMPAGDMGNEENNADQEEGPADVPPPELKKNVEQPALPEQKTENVKKSDAMADLSQKKKFRNVSPL